MKFKGRNTVHLTTIQPLKSLSADNLQVVMYFLVQKQWHLLIVCCKIMHIQFLLRVKTISQNTAKTRCLYISIKTTM